MRKRDIGFVLILLAIGWWAVPHIKQDLTRAVIPDRVERLFPRLIDRLTRDRDDRRPLLPDRRMESRIEIDRLANRDPIGSAPHETATVDHGYGW